ncbi:MAG: hypothetical protein AB1757_01475 [Acidobacteriota bacterium]
MQSAFIVFRLARHLSVHVAHTIESQVETYPDDWRLDLASIILFGAFAGVSVGAWTGGIHTVYVASKVPLLLIGTLLIGLPSMALLGRLLGCSLSLTETASLTLSSIARTAVVLGALSPVTTYFALTLPSRGVSVYRAVVLLQVFSFAIAGFVGVAALRKRLARVVLSRSHQLRIICLWLFIYSFVGAQLTWLLRPFLGNPGATVEYLRPYGERIGVDSNFYVSVYLLIKHSLF